MAELSFKRFEKKYLLDQKQSTSVMEALLEHMQVDAYGESTICNIYYDTPNYRLIRTSIEKPDYKEKLRLRTYGVPGAEDRAFLEIKKKCEGIVYKRRISMPYSRAMSYLEKGNAVVEAKACQNEEKVEELKAGLIEFGHYVNREGENSGNGRKNYVNHQITSEIDYFLRYYGELIPACVLCYDRIALQGVEDPGIRVTIDSGIRWRTDEMDLKLGDHGKQLLEGKRLMEVKVPSHMPDWLISILNDNQLYPTSFSKYGTVYKEGIYPGWMGKLS